MENPNQNRKLEVISQLMEELQDLMSPGCDELDSRLGRKKPEPDMAVMEIGVEPMEGEDVAMDGDFEEGPEDSLKKRIMKMRG